MKIAEERPQTAPVSIGAPAARLRKSNLRSIPTRAEPTSLRSDSISTPRLLWTPFRDRLSLARSRKSARRPLTCRGFVAKCDLLTRRNDINVSWFETLTVMDDSRRHR
jgi:hypothetical protein